MWLINSLINSEARLGWDVKKNQSNRKGGDRFVS